MHICEMVVWKKEGKHVKHVKHVHIQSNCIGASGIDIKNELFHVNNYDKLIDLEVRIASGL